MNKTELLHYHGLLVQVADALRHRGVIGVADLEPYLELDVTPVSIGAPRGDHERAVRTLATLLAAAVEEHDGRSGGENENERGAGGEGEGVEPSVG